MNKLQGVYLIATLRAMPLVRGQIFHTYILTTKHYSFI